MAKKALLDVLEQTIGKYVKNLDAESLNVAVWSGRIELHQLELDVDAVNKELDRQAAIAPNLAIPFRVRSGRFESFQVNVPWAHLSSQSVVLRAKGLHVQVEPQNRTEALDPLFTTAETEILRAQNLEKQRVTAIQIANDFRTKSNALRQLAEQDLQTDSNQSFGARLVRRIVENIQMEVSDVKISVLGHQCAAGVVLESFVLSTTDSQGKRAYVDRTVTSDSFLFKALNITGLGIYLDDEPSLSRNLPIIREDQDTSDKPEAAAHDYVLAPLTLTVRMRQADSNKCLDYPKYTLTSELPFLAIILNQNQVDSAFQLASLIQPSSNASHPIFPEYRPLQRVNKDSAKLWWKYAYRCVQRLTGKSLWREFFYAYRHRKQYVALYKRNAHSATCSWLSPLKPDEVSTLLAIERNRTVSIDALMIWRSIADAQMEKEKEKHALNTKTSSQSLYASLFGSSSTKEVSSAPITLSTAELRELESGIVSHGEIDDVSGNLCQVKFILQSFRIRLAQYDLRSLASLDMGIVATELNAQSDGAFQFSFQLSSLEIRDHFTLNSLFPVVLTKQESNGDDAFSIKFDKTAAGDQSLQILLHTFQAVASPLLLQEFKIFFSPNVATIQSKNGNPLLKQSMSGSVDLFYDATEGAQPGPPMISASVISNEAIINDLSLALVDAWRAKTAKKSALRVDVDIQAPILVVPENCVDSKANILIFDLGHLRLQYGIDKGGENVLNWFRGFHVSPEVIEHGSLQISSLAFLLGRSNDWQRLATRHENFNVASEESILDPISLTVEFGVEGIGPDPRICAFASVKQIIMSISTEQASRALQVSAAWRKIISFDYASDSALESSEHFGDRRRRSLSNDSHSVAGIRHLEAKPAVNILSTMERTPFPKIFCRAELKRLSMSFVSERSSSLEGHLLSVATSCTLMTNGDFLVHLSMGFFCICDRFLNDFPRKQRLVAHSTLPNSIASPSNYDVLADVLAELERAMLLNDVCIIPKSLANIVWELSNFDATRREGKSTVRANFSSLYVNWNPLAVKVIASQLGKLESILETQPDIIVVSNQLPSVGENEESEQSSILAGSPFDVEIELEGFQLCLNSAKDDMPLFAITMTSTRVARNSYVGGDSETFLTLGNLTIVTPDSGRTDPHFRTVLGLAPGNSCSLLSVKYSEGAGVVKNLSIEDSKSVEAYGQVELSPMRLVYIHAQILALVEYATEGILGVLANHVATSAAKVAAELAAASDSKKVFSVSASSLAVLVPRAAYDKEYFTFNSGALHVLYEASADSSSKAAISLLGCNLHDSEGQSLLECPIQMNLGIVMPIEDAGSKDDEAFRVSASMPKTRFVIPKRAYALLLAVLSDNIGDSELHLREEAHTWLIEGTMGTTTAQITHAGIDFVEYARRIYVDVEIGSLSLELAGFDFDDSILRLAAVSAVIRHEIISDEGRTLSRINLGNLICDDLRVQALSRQYRSLVYQPSADRVEPRYDVFSLVYESKPGNATSLEVSVGAPHLVVIPDLISDILRYISIDEGSLKTPPSMPMEAVISKSTPTVDTTELVDSLRFKITTSKCSVIFVDLGSDVHYQNPGSLISTHVSSVAETIVLEGKFEAKLFMSSSSTTGGISSLKAEFHGDELECYTAFGRTREGALQIVEPTKLSCYLKFRQDNLSENLYDVKCAAMEPIEVILSMRNVALVTAIATSIALCFENEDEDVDPFLIPTETQRIEQLASALEAEEGDSFALSRTSSIQSGTLLSRADSELDVTKSTSSALTVHVTAPASRLTLVNDLQGLDEPLLRIATQSSVASLKVNDGEVLSEGSQSYTGFHLNSFVSIMGDFFDQTTNTWKPLFLKPWEVACKGVRAKGERSVSPRPYTTVDLECFPCHLSFSEQFLMSLASASRMWQVYLTATEKAVSDIPDSNMLRKSLAASAARKFIVTLPYAIENHTGFDAEFFVGDKHDDRRFCASGWVEYFRFEPPRARGSAGVRCYGQDILVKKKLTIVIGNSTIPIGSVDDLVGSPRQSYAINDQDMIMVGVVKEGKTIIVHLSSGIEIENACSVPFDLVLSTPEGNHDLGICAGNHKRSSNLTNRDGKVSRISRRFVVPAHLLRSFWFTWSKNGVSELRFVISPQFQSPAGSKKLQGCLDVSVNVSAFNLKGNTLRNNCEVTCRYAQPNESCFVMEHADPFVIKVSTYSFLDDDRIPSLSLIIEPRAKIENQLPVAITVKSPMPHLIGQPSLSGENDTFDLKSASFIEVFTPGPSLALTVKCCDLPVGGTVTGWMEGGWVDLPLTPEFQLTEPLRCLFPFTRRDSGLKEVYDGHNLLSLGSEFFIAQGTANLAEHAMDCVAEFGDTSKDDRRKGGSLSISPSEVNNVFFITASYLAVDHTGEILFEQLLNNDKNIRSSIGSARHSSIHRGAPALAAFSGEGYNRRISLLPGYRERIQLVHLSMEGDEGLRKSAPFSLEDISICEGGVDATPIKWENDTDSGFYAYHRIVSSYRSELHVVPEFIVYNGSNDDKVRVCQPGGLESVIDPGCIAPLRTSADVIAVVTIEILSKGGITGAIRVDSLGLRVAIVRDRHGQAIGSVAIQTVVGGPDSRLVVKLGDMKHGATNDEGLLSLASPLVSDTLRLRVRWTELHVSMYEARPIDDPRKAFLENAMDRLNAASPTGNSSKGSWMDARPRSEINSTVTGPICSISFQRFTIDWQRVFKDDIPTQEPTYRSPERAQLAVVIHNVLIKDDTPGSPYPIVFDSRTESSFLDLIVRFKGPLNADLIKVDNFELNLAHGKEKSEKIVVNTSEAFVWKFLDLANRIIMAAEEFAGVEIELTWDDTSDGYKVLVNKTKISERNVGAQYTPPQSSTLFDIGRVYVSPFTVVVSFRRNPLASRYAVRKGGRGASMMNYFTRSLKFQIEKAELNFARYEARGIKGPPDRLLEILMTVYLSRLKLKFLTILSAASFQDWKNIASRDGGDDEFVEGDILRAAGNLTGKTANLVFRKTGQGIGHGVRSATSALGNSIEAASGAVGARPVGAGVNSVVKGIGGGVADTISGVGQGAGQVLKGGAKGVGQVFGGGGAVKVTKGIGRGITQGDGKALVSGFSEGLSSVGAGVGQGVGSVVQGTAEGVFSVGKGMFSGAKSIGRGIGGAFKGKKASQS